MTEILEFFKNVKHVTFSMGINDILEILIMTVLLYFLFAWIKDTRTWFVFKGIIVILIFLLLATILKLNTILYIAKNSFDIIILALIVVFQPELRNTLERIGRNNKLLNLLSRRTMVSDTKKVSEEIIKATYNMAETKTGALIIIERVASIDDHCTSSLPVDAIVSQALLENIFVHNTPLHDGAVQIRDGRILAAECILPITKNPNVNKALGTRHRAALGISEVTDCVAVVASEETGHVSVAIDGKLTENIKAEDLRAMLDDIFDEDENKKKKSRKKFVFEDKKKSVKQEEEAEAEDEVEENESETDINNEEEAE